jgi:adenylyl-sulfate kinase
MRKNFTIWLTGLPCSGKTTIAEILEKRLKNKGFTVAHLDGDDVRKKLNKDLGFSNADRRENLRRVAHVCQLFNDKGFVVISSFVSPTDEFRKMIKEIIDNLVLIYVKCSVEECEKRDVKGMYKKARDGEIENFTGISAPFEVPEDYDVVVDSENSSVEECVDKILEFLNF